MDFRDQSIIVSGQEFNLLLTKKSKMREFWFTSSNSGVPDNEFNIWVAVFRIHFIWQITFRLWSSTPLKSFFSLVFLRIKPLSQLAQGPYPPTLLRPPYFGILLTLFFSNFVQSFPPLHPFYCFVTLTECVITSHLMYDFAE